MTTQHSNQGLDSALLSAIRAKTARLGVIGLGYVGLPVACILAKSGFHVTGLDINVARVATLNAGISPFEGEEPGVAELIAEGVASGMFRADTDYTTLKDAQVVIICVDTPVDPETHYPAYRPLRAALESLGRVLADGALVIVESTIAPGTMTRVVIPELEQSSGKKAGTDFFVGHCPERVTPGRLLYNLTHMSRSVGGQTPEIAEVMVALYQNYVQADLDLTDPLTAEIVKTAENAYRDVQIAFANELAVICEQLGADVYTVRELVNKSPGRDVLLPGAGVGGHCIPKDPWLLVANVGDAYEPRLIPAARAVNDRMPLHVVGLLERALSERYIPLAGAKIAVLGYAFREETDDDRESPSKYLVDELRRRGAIPAIHDPYVAAYRRPLEEVVKGAQAAVIMVAHRAYRSLDLADLRGRMAQPILVDGRRVIEPAAARAAGFRYIGVGTPGG
jgi:UDP-N-acetyl-D-mannosaminuronic acid dehydrogenase